MAPVLWLFVFVGIAILGAVVTWWSVRRLWASFKALRSEVLLSLQRLGAAATFFDALGSPTPWSRTAGQRGALERA
jgi:hypothetical protein